MERLADEVTMTWVRVTRAEKEAAGLVVRCRSTVRTTEPCHSA